MLRRNIPGKTDKPSVTLHKEQIPMHFSQTPFSQIHPFLSTVTFLQRLKPAFFFHFVQSVVLKKHILVCCSQSPFLYHMLILFYKITNIMDLEVGFLF